MDIRLFNTRTRKKEVFTPLKKSHVGLYACGPTVYSYQHIGNMRPYVLWDCLRRMLEYMHFRVTYVVNITDVGHLVSDADEGEDKMEIGAQREGRSVWEVAEYYTKAFFDDIASLDVRPPTTWCKATDHIEQQAALVQRIIDNGFAYVTKDGIYFDTSKLPSYGKLIPNFSPDALQAGKRVALGEKRNATDFALWKFSPPDEERQMEWDIRFSWPDDARASIAAVADAHPKLGVVGNVLRVIGFPGWHIECTAMACEYLGETFDIHTGGMEHIPVHHTNEIAQAEGAFGHDHVRYWLHNEWVLFGEEKVSKSKGHVLRVADLVAKGYDALDYRYFLLLTHYRKPARFSWDALDAARTARTRLTAQVVQLKEAAEQVTEMSAARKDFQARFVGHITDDLDLPGALALVHELLKSSVPDGEKLSVLLDWDQVLGLRLKEAERETFTVPESVQELVDAREAARHAKDFVRADALRAELLAAGWCVSDTPSGPVLTPR